MNVAKLAIRCILLFLALAASVAPLMFPTAAARMDTDSAWMTQNYGPALDALMPIRERVGMHVSYRSHHDLYMNVIEYSFVVGYDRNPEGLGLQRDLSAHVKMADAISIFDQMLKLHTDNPREEASSIQQKVRLKVWDLTERMCPAIKTQFREFQAVRFGPPRFDVVVVDPLIREFAIQTGAGDMYLSLVDDRDPLVAWGLRTRQALEMCEAEEDRSSERDR